jgi:hydrogenase maturation protein HypF
MPDASRPTDACRLAITVRGVVQGVGFRPFLYNAARSRGLVGWVRNASGTVHLEVQGPSEAIRSFCDALHHSPPPQSRIEAIDVREIPCVDNWAQTFEILASAADGTRRPTVPADLTTCDQCLAEVRTPGERRYRYPFTNCTNCGPRWSIIVDLPYDRPRTSMAAFAMCPDCEAEYLDPADRRFHAQPIACPACGPSLKLLDRQGRPLSTADEALRQAAAAVVEGEVLALKGLGGFQLIVDATNRDVVATLRRRKRRPSKPFAVMLASMEEVRRWCDASEEEEQLLRSVQAPIVLLRRKDEGWLAAERSEAPAIEPGLLRWDSLRSTHPTLAEEVAPGNPYLGVMLPYTPLHHLLLEAIGRPVVCTSGNLSEEPMAIETSEAIERLGQIADLYLVHNRPIVRPVDDSVARVAADGVQLLRRARGYAPSPVRLGLPSSTILAVGGHLKNTVALSLDGEVVLSPHVGDLDNVLGVEVHERAVRDLVGFFQAAPEIVACDVHPDYASTRHAERLAAKWGVPLVRVQHHHAHVAAAMAEHGFEGPVLGLSWDGTGYGPDGTVWGGEFLVCHRGEYNRFAHLRTFPLPGGDRATREPRRSALGLLFELLGDEAAELVANWFTPAELRSLVSMLNRPQLNPRTSSMGRLFDALACLCGMATVIDFEGQAAMALEFAADTSHDESYPLPLAVSPATGRVEPTVVDWAPLVQAVLADRAAEVPAAAISARFHNALAALAVDVARHWGGRQVILTGGCFQNALLTERVRNSLLKAGFEVYTHRLVPPGDGGIALGQVFVAAQQVR